MTGSSEIAHGREARDASASRLFRPVIVVLAIWVLFGGNAPNSLVLFGALAVSGSVMIALTLVHGGLASWTGLPHTARAMLAALCLLPLVQLVPLPPSMWQALPGRALATGTLDAAGMAADWRPITLSVEETFCSFLVMAWLAALLLALLQLSSAELRRVFLVLAVFGLLNVAVGVIQVASGNTAMQIYHGLNSPFLNGLFANKNHTGLFLALTYLTGYAALFGEHGWDRRRMVVVVPAGLVLFVALLATFSRAGVIFGLLAIGFLALLSSGRQLRGKGRYLAIAMPLIGIALFAALASTDLVSRSLARFGGVDTDLRWSIWQWSWPLVVDQFPVGSGIGSFTTLFPPHEQLAWVKPTYVNHAHNDYLEQLIEIGAAAPVLWALIVAALIRPARLAWVARDRPSGRLAMVGVAMLFLMAVHSAFDYPLRRPAIAATAMVALAAVLRMNGRGKSRLRSTAGYARQTGK